MSLGEKIQQLRKATGLSQEQLADQLNVSRQAVSKWELNDSIPDVDKIVLISNLFSISTDELLQDRSQTEQKIQPEGSKINPVSLERIVKMNLASKQITLGFCTMIVGFVMLVLEYMFLPLFGWIHKTIVNGHGFYSDAIRYAKVQPMPTIFALTAIIIIIGAGFMIIGYFSKKKRAE